ncbi:hypothetical protein OXX69_004200 [Metschnikowia pulcherrima]
MIEAAKIFEDIKGVFSNAELISTSNNVAETFTSTTFGGNYRYPRLNKKSESRPLIIRHPADELRSTASPYRKSSEHGM